MEHEGGCTCGHLRYVLNAGPFAVHCCHCTTCQIESGSAFALNGLIETDNLRITAGSPVIVETPSESGKGQNVARCPHCHVAVWSHYMGMGEKAAFVRIGTLDEPKTFPPQVHIFVRSKQAWVNLPGDASEFEVFYSRADMDRLFGADGAARYRALRGI